MDFLALVVAGCAFWLVLSALKRSRQMTQELSALREELGRALARLTSLEPAKSPIEGIAKPAARPTKPIIADEVPLARNGALPVAEAPPTAAPEPMPMAPAPTTRISVPSGRAPAKFDERSGSRALVWIGGVAVALAGIFLVKYSIDAGYLGPTARVTSGLILGLALLGAGEWMLARSRPIAQSLSAAGIADLYASLYAAVALYQLASPIIGFSLMAMVTAGAIALALRQGAFVGLLGLAGGFLTPAIVGDSNGNTAVLLVYLYLIQAGTHVLVRRCGWWWLSAIALAGGMIWAALLIARPLSEGDRICLTLFFLASMATANWAIRRPGAIAPSLLWVARGAGAASLLLAAGMVASDQYASLDWLLFGSIAALQLWFARSDPSQEPLAASASALGLALLWGTLVPDQRNAAELLSIAGGFGALFAIAGYALMWGARCPVFWASLSGGTPAAVFAVTYLRFTDASQQPPWGWISLGLAAIFLAGAERVARYRAQPGFNDALGAMALAVTLFVAMTVPLVLHHAWIGVAWSLQLVAMGWVERLLDLPWIRRAGLFVLAAVLTRLVVQVFTGLPPALDWITYGYGIPALAFAAAAQLFRRPVADRLVDILEGSAIFSLFLMLSLVIRQYFHGEDLIGGEIGTGELSVLVNVWLLLALGLGAADRRFPRLALDWGNRAVAAVAMAALAGGSLLLRNPVLFSLPVGDGPLINMLVPGYLLPALLLVLQAWRWRKPDPLHFADFAGGLALLLGIAFVSLEVRHWFHGDVGMTVGRITEAENYSYSAVWILYGGLLLAVGILGQGKLLRYASLAVVGATICKVFLVDAAALAGLFRVFSFLGLGLSLILLGYLYQRFVFHRLERS